MEQSGNPDFPVRYRLKRAMEVAHLEPEDVAERLQVHPNTVRNWLAGRRLPRRPALAMIAEMTGVQLSWLEGVDAPPDTAPLTRGERVLNLLVSA